MIAFIEAYRADYGVKPICRVLPIALSTFYQQAAIARDPAKASPRARRDRELMAHIRRIWQDNRAVYGAHKVWHSLQHEGGQDRRQVAVLASSISMVFTIHIDAIHIWAASALSLSKQEWHHHFLTGIKPLQVQSSSLSLPCRHSLA